MPFRHNFEKQKLEYNQKTTNLKHYEEQLIRRLEILKLYKQYSKIIVNSEIDGLQKKINRCRKSLGLPLLKDPEKELPKRPIPSSIQKALLSEYTPIKLRKSLEHPGVKRCVNSSFWGYEKKKLRESRVTN